VYLVWDSKCAFECNVWQLYCGECVPYSPCHTSVDLLSSATHCNTLHHTATRCNTLQHTATHCNTLQHTATYHNTPQHAATWPSACAPGTLTRMVWAEGNSLVWPYTPRPAFYCTWYGIVWLCCVCVLIQHIVANEGLKQMPHTPKLDVHVSLVWGCWKIV